MLTYLAECYNLRGPALQAQMKQQNAERLPTTVKHRRCPFPCRVGMVGYHVHTLLSPALNKRRERTTEVM